MIQFIVLVHLGNFIFVRSDDDAGGGGDDDDDDDDVIWLLVLKF